MCGIAGQWSWSGSPDAGALKAMAEVLRHRGPDDDGLLITRRVGFAHRRLSIIDLAGSPQPMTDDLQRLHVCFNGEILNYRGLRAETPYPYRTNGDTEVLLAVFRAHGPAGADRLVGQFAYALHDTEADELFLVRDPSGILPLYYCNTPYGFWFASEIKALIAGMGGPPPVDSGVLGGYLRNRYVAAPDTLFQGIRKVPPGHYVRVSRAGVTAPAPYGNSSKVVASIDDEAALERLNEVLTTAVSRNLVADVPVGAFLSGGLDSSLLTALAAAARPQERLLTFSAGIDDPRWNELPHARRVAQHLGTEHHEITVAASDFEHLLPQLTWFRDAPISEPSDTPVHLLAPLAREHVKVALSGEGADELFGGYPKYRLADVTRLAGLVPAMPRGAALRAIEKRLPPDRWRLRTAIRAMAADSERARSDAWFESFSAAEAAALLGQQHVAGRHSTEGRSALRRMMTADVEGWLPDNLLERADRMAMSASLETRPPFLDRDVVALSHRLTHRQLVRGYQTKWLLKEYARAKLPSGIADRPKVGFRVPIGDWFRTHLRESVRQRLLDPGSFIAQIF